MGEKRRVHAITSVPRALSADVHSRTVRYLVSMAVRTGCLFGALLTTGVLRWVMITGAIVLPYIAVVAANAGRERPQSADSLMQEEAPSIGADASQGGDAGGAAHSNGATSSRADGTGQASAGSGNGGSAAKPTVPPGLPVDLRGGYLR